MSCKTTILTATDWWQLIKAVTEEIYTELLAIRRDRSCASKRENNNQGVGVSLVGPFTPFMFGQAGELECLAHHHYNPLYRPKAWVTVEFRLGPTRVDEATGRTIWTKSVEVWAQLPQARWSKRSWSKTVMGRKRAVVNWKGAQQLVRKAERETVRNGHPALVPQSLPIDPQETPKEVTCVHLVLCLWQRNLIELDPQGSPEAWAFLKWWFNVADRSAKDEDRAMADDSKLAEVLGELRRNYVLPEDWRGLRKYAGKTLKSVAKRYRLNRDGDSLEDDSTCKKIERHIARGWRSEQQDNADAFDGEGMDEYE